MKILKNVIYLLVTAQEKILAIKVTGGLHTVQQDQKTCSVKNLTKGVRPPICVLSLAGGELVKQFTS